MPAIPNVNPGNPITAKDWNDIVDDLNLFTQALEIKDKDFKKSSKDDNGGNLFIKGNNALQNAGDHAILFLGDQNHFIKAERSIGLTIGVQGGSTGLVISTDGDTRIGGGNAARAKLEIDGGDLWTEKTWNKNLLLTAPSPSLVFSDGSNTAKFGIGLKPGNNENNILHLYSTDGAPLLHNHPSAEGQAPSHLVIKQNGNVGIGTSDPKSTLQIGTKMTIQVGTDNAGSKDAENSICYNIYWGDNSNRYIRDGPASLLRFEKDGHINFQTGDFGESDKEIKNFNSRLTIKNNGNVGIGTDNPTEKLAIAGNVVVNPDFKSEAKVMLGDGNHFIKSVPGQGVTISTVNHMEISANTDLKLYTGNKIYINAQHMIEFRSGDMGSNSDTNIDFADFDTGYLALYWQAGVIGIEDATNTKAFFIVINGSNGKLALRRLKFNKNLPLPATRAYCIFIRKELTNN